MGKSGSHQDVLGQSSRSDGSDTVARRGQAWRLKRRRSVECLALSLPEEMAVSMAGAGRFALLKHAWNVNKPAM